MFDLNWLALILQERITKSGVSWNAISDFAKNGARRSLETKIHAEFLRQPRDDHPVSQRLMHRVDGLAHPLHKTIVVRVGAVDLGKRSRRQHHVRKCSGVRVEEFLDNDEIKFAKRLRL